MALLTVTELRNRVNAPDHDDAALGDLLEWADSLIIKRVGPHYDSTDFIDVFREGKDRTLLSVSRQINLINSITDSDGTVYGADDVTIVFNKFAFIKKNSRFCGLCKIQYRPVDDTATRKIVTSNLIQIELDTRPLKSASIEGRSFSFDDRDRQVELILSYLQGEQIIS